jgi:hypothetical protein
MQIVNRIDREQLIQMLALPSETNIADDDNVRIVKHQCRKTVSIGHCQQTKSESKSATFLSSLFSFVPSQTFTFVHLLSLSHRTLRCTFIVFILLIGLTSFTSALITGSIFLQFKQKCSLFASFKFDLISTHDNNWTIRIAPLSEKFTSQVLCDFCTFYNVLTFIYCVMTCFFFILFNGDHRIVTSNDRCLIIPWYGAKPTCHIQRICSFQVSHVNCSIVVCTYQCININQWFS